MLEPSKHYPEMRLERGNEEEHLSHDRTYQIAQPCKVLSYTNGQNQTKLWSD